MKNIGLIIIFIFMLFNAKAQKAVTIAVEDVNTEQAIQIIENAANDLNYSFDKFDGTNKILITKFFSWTSIAIENHAKLKFEAKNNTVIITMIERQYKSDEGWVNSPTNLSKKNIKKYLGTFADKITVISANNDLAKKAVENSMLIRAFIPLVKKEGLIIKYVKGTRNMEGKGFNPLNTVLELDITNTKSDTVKLHNAAANYYGGASFKEPKTEVRFRIYDMKLAPGETGKLFLYFKGDEYLKGNKKNLLEKLIFTFGLQYKEMAAINIKIESYNITVPFEN